MRVAVAMAGCLVAMVGVAGAGGTPPPSVAITHSASLVPVDGASFSCDAGSYHDENSYYRAFDLAALYEPLAPLRITGIEIGVEEAVDTGGGQPIDVNLYTIAALPPSVAGLNLVAATTATVFTQSLTTVLIPIDAVVPRDAILVVEVHTANGVAGNNLFRLGANSEGQTAPSYMRAASCVISQIEEMAALGRAGTHWIMVVHGGPDLPPTPPMCTQGYARFADGTPVALNDDAITTSTLLVSGMDGRLLDLNLVTDLRHTFAADLDVTLTSPQGTVVTITTDNGGGNDDVFAGTVWDDDANPGGTLPHNTNDGLVTDQVFLNGVTVPLLVPEEGLAGFVGEDPNGTWTLTVSDDLVGETGTLDGWGLEITTAGPSPEVASATYENTTPVTVPPGPAVVTSTIDVSGAPPYLVGLSLDTLLPHSFPGDLDVTLTSPDGTVVTLTSDNAGTNDDAFAATTWSPVANPGGQVPYATNDEMVTDRTYASGVPALSLTPEESFGAFVGENPNGTWTLTVSDDTATDGGELSAWTLNVHTLECVPTTTTTTTTLVTTTSLATTTTIAATTTTAVAATSTTIVPGATTTTTTIPGGCARAASIDSVRCRLAAMIAQVGVDVPAPGRSKLSAFLTRADAAVGKAGGLESGSAARRRAVRKATRFVRKFDRKLGGGLGRAVPDDARAALRDDAASVLADLPPLA